MIKHDLHQNCPVHNITLKSLSSDQVLRKFKFVRVGQCQSLYWAKILASKKRIALLCGNLRNRKSETGGIS